MTGVEQVGSSANGICWNLADLYQGADDPQIELDLENSLKRAQAFEDAYRGRIEVEGGPTAALLQTAILELEALSELMDRPIVYASLLHSAKTDTPQHGALLARTREQRVAINKHLIFFDLEWVHLPEASARPLLEAPELAHYRHYLEQKRAWSPHYLGEAEEKVLEEKDVTGRAAFVRLFEESLSTLACPYEKDGAVESLSLQQVLAKLYDPDREVRKAGATSLTAGLKANSRLLTFIFNTVILDHKSDCDIRNFSSPMASRHLANEIDDKVVDALLSTVERHHETVHRYYRLKAKLLKIDSLYDYDRYAPLFSDLPECDWPTARRIVEASYNGFSPQAGAIISEFFEKRWIDAELRPGKRSGAFSSSAVPSVHPYILMNHTDKLRDVMTLAHELGHGLHQYLSRSVGYLQCHTPLTTAETASVFGEMLTFQQLLATHTEPRTQLALLCGKIEDSFATVFRQVVLTRFEQTLHQARREQGELTIDQINSFWIAANQPMHGHVVKLTEGYAWWWLYIGHFIRSPFYCYAYAFGELLVLALFRKFQEEGSSFVPKYLELLSAGGADAPDRLLERLGVNVADPSFWELGMGLLDDMVTQAEALAEQIGNLS